MLSGDIINAVSRCKPQLVSLENTISTAVYVHCLFILNISAKHLQTYGVQYGLHAHSVPNTNHFHIYLYLCVHCLAIWDFSMELKVMRVSRV